MNENFFKAPPEFPSGFWNLGSRKGTAKSH